MSESNVPVKSTQYPFPVSAALEAATDKLVAVIGVNPLVAVFKRAEMVIAVRDWLAVPEVMSKIIKLKNTPAGFLTDEKEGAEYDEKTIANCVAEALLGGFQLVNNEFNIIAGKFMGVLNGYYRKVLTFENEKIRVLSLELTEGEISLAGNMVKVPMKLVYTYEDKTKENSQPVKVTFEQMIQLTQKSRDTADAWIGKASRRILKKLYVRLSGFDPGDDLGDESTAGTGGATTAPPVGVTPTAKPKVGVQGDAPQKAATLDATFTEIIANPVQEANAAPEAVTTSEPIQQPPTTPAAQTAPKTTKTGKPPVDAF